MTDNGEVTKEKKVMSENIDEINFPKFREDDWMLKPCDVYLSEYKDCKSINGRFYQNFYYGEILNCTQWKNDYNNCQMWQKKDDDTAYNELVVSEKRRRLSRLKPHVENDVWKRRSAPPFDWDEPLPEWMVKREESTFLAAKQKEIMEVGINYTKDSYIPSCSIL